MTQESRARWRFRAVWCNFASPLALTQVLRPASGGYGSRHYLVDSTRAYADGTGGRRAELIKRTGDTRRGETDDVASLRILASAIAGRAVDVAPADPGRRTWSDGSTIFLEPVVDRAERVRLLGVQASLIAAGSLDRETLDALGHGKDLARRYLAIEGHRALAVNAPALPPDVARLIERGRAEGLQSAHDSLVRAREQRSIEPDWVLGAIQPRLVRSVLVEPAAASFAERDRPHASQPNTTEAAGLNTLDEDDDGFDLGNMMTSPVGGGGPLGKLLAKLFTPSRRQGKGGSPGADAPTHYAGVRPGSGAAFMSTTALPEISATDPASPTPHTYPEWDVRANAYRPDWCSVLERDADEDSSVTVSRPDTRAMRRVLAPLGLGLGPSRRQKQGEDIDLDAVVEAQVDLAAGSPHDDDLYIENRRQRRDLSVLVLLDVSGSASEPATGGRTVHDQQVEAAEILVGALNELGDRVALYAFNSRGRHAVQVTAVKRFDDLLDGHVARRLHSLKPGAYTRVGAAVRHGTEVIDKQGGQPRRLLVVLSDGFAYDHGYEGRYGEADARRALLEARRRGVGCLCLSIGADTSTLAMRRVFGSAAHASVPAADRLPALVGPLFAAALLTAESQRRRYQRIQRTRERLEIEKE